MMVFQQFFEVSFLNSVDDFASLDTPGWSYLCLKIISAVLWMLARKKMFLQIEA